MQLRDVLFFPVTPFGPDGAIDTAALAVHLKQGLDERPGGVFVACGTGEFHALTLEEHEQAVRTAVEVVAGAVPVVAGAGGALPHAIACAQQAEAAGAEGLLLMPPYLVAGPPAGFVRYLDELFGATDLPVVLYQRDQIRLAPDVVASIAEHPQVVGLKDGTGDLDLMQRTVLAVRDRVGEDFQFFNGCPTAELTQAAYRAIGVPLYSSAVFAVAPSLSRAFFHAVEDGDVELRDRLLARFFRPLVELRDQVPGYAVALIKAGVRERGIEVGGVRPPLLDPTDEHLAAFMRLVEDAEAIVAQAAGGPADG